MTQTPSALDGLDPILNAPKRLAIMAVLAGSTSSDFAFLREHLGVSDSDLSKQTAALESAGYVTITVHGWNGDQFRPQDARRYEWQSGKWKLRKAPEPAH